MNFLKSDSIQNQVTYLQTVFFHVLGTFLMVTIWHAGIEEDYK